MAGLAATYVDADTFTVSTDLTLTFSVGRRIKANCGVDGYKFGTIESSSFGGGVTTVNLTAASDDLTSNLTEVWYGIVAEGTDGSVPIHSHDGSEGSGGEVTSLIKQIVTKNITEVITTNATIPYASTPTNASGVAFDSTAITLISASNIVRVQCVIPCDSDNDSGFPTALVHRGSTVLAVLATAFKKDVAGSSIYFDFYDTPGSVGPHEYSIRVGVQGNNGYFNQLRLDATPWGGTFYTNNCWLTLTEMAI